MLNLSDSIELMNERAASELISRFERGIVTRLIVDADSLLFNACYGYLNKDYNIELLSSEYVRQVESLINAVDTPGAIDISYVGLCYTKAKENFRYKLLSDYKANRKPTELGAMVKELKNHVIKEEPNINGVEVESHFDSMLEADDIVADLMAENREESIYAAIDKDLFQIEGLWFNYKKSPVLDDFGDKKVFMAETPNGSEWRTEKQYSGFGYTTFREGRILLAKQLLTGDNADNIKGAFRIGEKKSSEMLESCSTEFQVLKRLVESYYKYFITKKGEEKQTIRSTYLKHKGEKRCESDVDRLKVNYQVMSLLRI